MSVTVLVSLVALSVIGGLLLTLVVWLLRSALRERRRQRAMARLLTAHRRELPAGSQAGPVTVDELVARVQAEGLPVRLNWNEGQDTAPEADEWPTAVLPKVED